MSYWSYKNEQLGRFRLLFTIWISFLIATSPSASLAQTTRAKTAKLERNIRAELGFLASDAMQGRGSGSGYERIAAEYIGSQFRQFGLEPGGDTDASGQKGFVQRATIQAAGEASTWNAVGILRGSDPKAAKDAIMLSAHLDHLGTDENAAPGTDAIFNGADDDASGCVAVLELARALASGKRPKRTIYFVCFGSEERGGFGAQYFIAHSPVPDTNCC